MPEQFLKDQFNDIGTCTSPDGKWLAYSSNEVGDDCLFVCPTFSAAVFRAGWEMGHLEPGRDTPDLVADQPRSALPGPPMAR